MIDKYPDGRPGLISHTDVMKGFDKAIRKPFTLRDHGTSVIPVSRGLLDGLDDKIDSQLRGNKTLVSRILGFFK